ncbi:hypothetical protein K3495_g10993 [Podosphaera aphanis]|nr:hypothetical protein K3495_g10993 [Podosphaera aphanis]
MNLASIIRPEETKPIVMPPSSGLASSGGGVMADEKDAATTNDKISIDNRDLILRNIPPPKTDKPRPHVCQTCMRGFARLEHLKRHERSHTKEKPFECQACERRFARRDLLLRHQQKLHQSLMPVTKGRNRRESTTNPPPANGPGRGRKNSLANGRGAAGAMRPRANTISHVDTSLAHPAENEATPVAARQGIPHTHIRHASLAELPMHHHEFHHYAGLSANISHRGINHVLPKIETNNYIGVDYRMGLRTAPLMSNYSPDFEYEGFMYRPTSTINPNALHYKDSPNSLIFDPAAAFHTSVAPDLHTHRGDEKFDWTNSFKNGLSFHEKSSPSAIRTLSPRKVSDVMLDGSNNPATSSASMWPPTVLAPRMMNSNPFSHELGSSGYHHNMVSQGQPRSPYHTRSQDHEPLFLTPPLRPRPSSQNNFESLELN